MADQPKILAFAGSTREESYNKKLVKIAVAGAERQGASVTYIDLRDYPLPLYDQDYQDTQGLPSKAIELKQLMWDHEGLLIASPEYNSSISGVLKNTIDWVSRSHLPDESALSCFQNKVAVLMSASISSWGGIRGLIHVRSILAAIQVLVLPDQQTIPLAQEAFDAEGHLKDSKREEKVLMLGEILVNYLVHAPIKLRKEDV